MEDIDASVATEHGIENRYSKMENGELRFRLLCNRDKTAYIRTEEGEQGGWQNSHYHNTIRELYIVQKGKIVLAEYKNNDLILHELKENEIFITEPGTPHNVYLYPYSVTHTVKYGDIKEFDWIPSEELDNLVKGKNIEELL